MADYWKSNERKYCDFCKCWIAHNKPSVQFHESGRRHKLNVQKRITEMTKNSYKEQRVQAKVNEDMKKMNDGAMKAYMNDLAGGADISARAQLAIDRAAIGPQVDPMALPDDCWSDEEQSSSKKSKKKKGETPLVPVIVKPPPVEAAPVEESSMWCEAKTDEGNTYYWNVKTNESAWEPPKEGFMSYEEYMKISRVAYDKQEEEQKSKVKYEVDNAAEIAAKLKREQNRDAMEYIQHYSNTESDETKKKKSDSNKKSKTPYGSWEVVEHREKKPVDLQLPEVPAPLYVPSVHPEVPERRFKEKVITHIPADETSSLTLDTFIRKRKPAGNRNARQRLDD